MKRICSFVFALMLAFLPVAVSEVDPTVYPGIVAPLDESYVYAPVKALDGVVLASGGLYLHVAPDISSDVLVLVPCGAEFKLIAQYANGNIRVSLGLGKEFYTGYFCTDLNEAGVLYTTVSETPKAECTCKICDSCSGDGGWRGFRLATDTWEHYPCDICNQQGWTGTKCVNCGDSACPCKIYPINYWKTED